MMTWSGELDAAAELATRRGSWHVFLFYLLCSLAAIPTSFLVFSQVFTNATPEHWCAPQSELEALGLPEDLLKNLTIPGQQTYEECRAYTVDLIGLHDLLYDYVEESTASVKVGGVLRNVKVHQLRLTPADGELQRIEQIDRITQAILITRSKEPKYCSNGWRFSTQHYTRTLVTDFSLFCDKDWIPRMSNTLFWVGSIFGNLFFGWMSDRYGRRPTILLMIFLEVPLSIAASFSTTYWGYAALRVAGGLFFPALYQLPFILALELMPPKKRTYTGIVVGMLFATGMCTLAVLAYAVRDWYHLSLVTSLPFILLYSYYWLIPESPRWLVGRGRIADAEKVFRNLARKNGIQLQRGFLLELHKKIKDVEEAPTSDAEIAMLPNINGHIAGTADKEEYDRRISNMLTFKPDLTRINEEERDIERIIALEVADIVNKKTRIRDIDEVSQNPSPTKSTQTDFAKSPSNSLRRKSIQLVSKIFIQDEGEEDVMENKRMDDQNSEGDCKASPLDVFRYPNIRKKFLLLTFDWIALGVVYNSLSYNSPNLGVDDYLAFFIGGAVELPSYFLAWRGMERFGRRWVLCCCMCVGALACLSCALVPDSWPWITVSLAMVARLCCAASFAVFYVVAGELLPTVARAQALAAAACLAGLALLAVPHLVHLAVYWRALPLIIMGVLSALGGITSLFLPETLRQPLPQTLADGEAMGRRFKVLSCVEPEEKR